MSNSESHSLKKVLKQTNNYLLAAILFSFFLISVTFAVILYQSQETFCELFRSKIENSGHQIAKEMALGKSEASRTLLNDVISSLSKVSAEVSLKINFENNGEKFASCDPGIFKSDISHELDFSGNEVTYIAREIKWFTTEILILLAIVLILLAIILLNFIKNRIMKSIVSPMEKLCEEKDFSYMNPSSEVSKIASQVAHDIRSPLEMLKGLNDKLGPLSE